MRCRAWKTTAWSRHSLLLSQVSHPRIPQSITSVVSSKLSRSDLVQWGKVGKNIFFGRQKAFQSNSSGIYAIMSAQTKRFYAVDSRYIVLS